MITSSEIPTRAGQTQETWIEFRQIHHAGITVVSLGKGQDGQFAYPKLLLINNTGRNVMVEWMLSILKPKCWKSSSSKQRAATRR